MIRAVPVLLVLAAALFPGSTPGEEIHVGGHFQNFEEFRKIVDLRCTVCHSRERVEAAARQGRELAPIEQRMLERGAVLTDREKEVLGTFWGEPLKKGKEAPPGSFPK